MEQPPSSIAIRPARPGDVPLILGFIRELAEYEREPNAVVATAESLHEHLFGADNPSDERPSPPRCRVEALIGELDGRPEGFALYFFSFSTWLGASGIYLEDLYVRPAARRRGLGAALLRRLAQIAVDRGCGRLEWAVLNWNEPAIQFYRSLGARPMDEWTTFRLTGPALHQVASR